MTFDLRAAAASPTPALGGSECRRGVRQFPVVVHRLLGGSGRQQEQREPNFLPREDQDQYLRDWMAPDFERLGLSTLSLVESTQSETTPLLPEEERSTRRLRCVRDTRLSSQD